MVSAAEKYAPCTPVGDDAQADDLTILMPDGEIEIGGEKITVKALRFGDQMRHGATLKALTEAMKACMQDEGVGSLLDAFAANSEGIYGLLEAATGKPRDWIEALTGEEGEALLLFWTVNKDFFERRLIAYPALSQVAAIRAMSAGATSSPPSSATATALAS